MRPLRTYVLGVIPILTKRKEPNMTWKRVQINCQNFKCANNEKGNCSLEEIHLVSTGTPLIDQMICQEAKEKPFQPEPSPDE